MESLSFVRRDKFGYGDQLTPHCLQRICCMRMVPNKSLVEPGKAGESGREVVHLASLGHYLLLSSALSLLQKRLLLFTL